MTATTRPTGRDPRALIHAIGGIEQLDPIAATITKVVQRATKPALVKNGLSGTGLGHQLHPLLTDVTIGAWLSATVVDVIGGESGAPAAKLLTGVGVLSAVPTAASGLSDWSDSYGADQRIGLVHAIANSVGLVLQIASFAARRRGSRGVGAALSMTGLGVAGAAGYLGGHLVYARGMGVNHTAYEYRTQDWTDVADEQALEENVPLRVDAQGVAVVVVKSGAALFALSARCTHAGGPLDEGEVADGCLSCPWHGSRFQLVDGRPVHGPAAVAQPVWETRVEAGRVQVRAAD
jgi:nitrite reductase/ring-hydroxylating ferredoxin subunit/uncharacterized membrane protein